MAELAIVTAIAREKVSSGAMDDVAFGISDYLIADMALPRACQLNPVGSLSLLDLVWMRSVRDKNAKHWSVAKLLQTDPLYKRWAFSKALEKVVARGDFDMLQWLLRHLPECPVTKEVVVEAARAGQLATLQYLTSLGRHEGIEWSEESVNAAAENGQWELVRWLLKRTTITDEVKTSNKVLVQSAMKQNNLGHVKWAVANGFGVNLSIPQYFWQVLDCSKAEWATRSGIYRYLLIERKGDTKEIAMYSLVQAASFGDLDFVLWIITQFVLSLAKRDWSDAFELAATYATRYNHVSVVRWLLSFTPTHCSPSLVMFAAAETGNLDVVQWLYDRYARSDADLLRKKYPELYSGHEDGQVTVKTAIDVAACNGHLGVVRFLHEPEPPKMYEEDSSSDYEELKTTCTSTAMDGAAANGHLEVVQWLHVHCPEICSESAMGNAAVNGHLEVVQWLHWNRSERLDPTIVDRIVEKEYKSASTNAARIFDQKMLAMVQWFHSNRLVEVTTSAMDAAASKGKLEMVKWLNYNTQAGCTTRAMDKAATHGHLEVVKWLHENRSEGCSTAAIEGAARNGYVGVVKWLSVNLQEHFSSRAIVCAATEGHLKVVRWLVGNDTETFHVVEAMIEAISHGHFEITLFLHAQTEMATATRKCGA